MPQVLSNLDRLLASLPPEPSHRCSYLSDRLARMQSFGVAQLPPGVYEALLELNFRRSGQVIYRTACDQCRECQAIRVPVAQFRPDRSQRRCLARNRDLDVRVIQPTPTPEKHELFCRYLDTRHDRQMGASWSSFCDFLYESPICTREVEYRLGDRLMAVGIADEEPTAASLVYCYFDPQEAARSLGVFNVLWTVEYCRARGLPYLYLGYYIRDCAKMNYKARYRPCEIRQPDGTWLLRA